MEWKTLQCRRRILIKIWSRSRRQILLRRRQERAEDFEYDQRFHNNQSFHVQPIKLRELGLDFYFKSSSLFLKSVQMIHYLLLFHNQASILYKKLSSWDERWLQEVLSTHKNIRFTKMFLTISIHDDSFLCVIGYISKRTIAATNTFCTHLSMRKIESVFVFNLISKND